MYQRNYRTLRKKIIGKVVQAPFYASRGTFREKKIEKNYKFITFIRILREKLSARLSKFLSMRPKEPLARKNGEKNYKFLNFNRILSKLHSTGQETCWEKKIENRRKIWLNAERKQNLFLFLAHGYHRTRYSSKKIFRNNFRFRSSYTRIG